MTLDHSSTRVGGNNRRALHRRLFHRASKKHPPQFLMDIRPAKHGYYWPGTRIPGLSSAVIRCWGGADGVSSARTVAKLSQSNGRGLP